MTSINQLKGMASSKLGFARSNQFLIELPRLENKSAGAGGLLGAVTEVAEQFIPSIPGLTPDRQPNSRELNTLCRSSGLPGKQILTTDRKIGMVNEKIAYGYAVSDISLTFYMLNDYSVKNYFDAWMDLILDDGYNSSGQKTAQIAKYKDEYAKPIKIHQLRKPQIGFSANLGPITANAGFGGGSVYSVELFEAFPTTVNEITFSNDLDGIIEMTVAISFTNWKRVKPSQNFINIDVGF
jgi:hypothetical protein